MIRMSGADSMMLTGETSRAYMHTIKMAILDPSSDPEGWSFERYFQDFASRIHLVPMLRWKCAHTPLWINHPMWLDDPNFDLAYHIRQVTCPAPGDQKALCEFISSIYAGQLDRNRPLWMCQVVEGLEDGKVASVTLLHHAYVDGIGALYNLRQLAGSEPGGKPEPAGKPWQPRAWPSWRKRLFWGVRDLPKIGSNLPSVVWGFFRKKAKERSLVREGKSRRTDLSMMRRTPLNATLSDSRSFACDSLPLNDFKRVSREFGVTINDVFLCCAAGVVRRLLQDVDYDPGKNPLIAGIPFARKRPAKRQGLGNYATVGYCWLHSDIEDPVERLMASHQAATEMKEHQKATLDVGVDVHRILQICPPWALGALRWYINRMRGRVGMFGNLMLSNVPGPREHLYFNSYRIENWFSTGQVFDGSCINLTLWSYCDNANLCVMADEKIVPDGWIPFAYFVEELAKLGAKVPDSSTAMETKG